MIDAALDDQLGSSVAIGGDVVAVGAIGEDDGDFGSGAVYAYVTGLPTGVLVVDAAYCAGLGFSPNNGSCIQAALAEANAFDGAIGTVYIAPGTLSFGGLIGVSAAS